LKESLDGNVFFSNPIDMNVNDPYDCKMKFDTKKIYPFLRWRLLLIALYNIHYLCIKMRVTYYKWVTLIFCEFLQKFSSIICA
jgi:hypothetical protein